MIFNKLDVNKYINLLDKIENIEKLTIKWKPIFYTEEREAREKLNRENFSKRCKDYSKNNRSEDRYCKNIDKKKYSSFNVEESQETWFMSWLHLYRFLEFYFDYHL